jgi:hypothetical protein
MPAALASTQLAMNAISRPLLCFSKDAQTYVSQEAEYGSPCTVGGRTARVSGLCAINRYRQRFTYWKPNTAFRYISPRRMR